MKKLLIACLLLATNSAYSEEISIYDSPSDKSKVVIEYCSDSGVCHRLITPRATLAEDSDKINEWIKELENETKNNEKK